VSTDEENTTQPGAGSGPELLRLREQGLNWRIVEGEVMILDDQGATYYAATGAAATLWPMLVAGSTGEALVVRLCDAFRIEADVARRDVAAFLVELEAHGLLGE
jgi:hypothetical protein